METVVNHPLELIQGLKIAAIQAMPLLAKAGKNPAPGLFPGTAKGKPFAKLAIEQGLIRLEKRPIPGGKKTEEIGVITDAGLALLANLESPRAALEALLPAVEALGSPAAMPSLDGIHAEIEKAVSSINSSLKTHFYNLEQTLKASFQPPTAKGPDQGAVLAAVRHAADRVKAPTPVAPVAVPAPIAPADTAILEQEIAGFVRRHVAETTVGCQLDVVMKHLRQRLPNVSVGAFHDALRKLHDASTIRLGGWPKTIYELPEPELELFVSSKVMYYAHTS